MSLNVMMRLNLDINEANSQGVVCTMRNSKGVFDYDWYNARNPREQENALMPLNMQSPNSMPYLMAMPMLPMLLLCAC